MTERRAGMEYATGPLSKWREQLATRHVLDGELISLANLIGRPVVDPAGSRLGRVSDVVVRWDRGVAHPPVVGVLVSVGSGFTVVAPGDVSMQQSEVKLRSSQLTVVVPVRQGGDVALARDVLDHQLVDVAGVEVVRAADVYLAKTAVGWELAGIDVGVWCLVRRLFRKRRTCPPPDRALDWADLQAFVPRFSDEVPAGSTGPASAASLSGSSVQMAYPAAALRKLRAKDVEDLLGALDRGRQAQLAALADSSAVGDALRSLEPTKLDALLAELDGADRARLLALLPEDSQ